MQLSKTPTIKYIKQPTSQVWIDQAVSNLDIILLDHSHLSLIHI